MRRLSLASPCARVDIIVFILIPRGKIFDKALEQAVAQGQVTPELGAAFAVRPVYAGHIYELASTFAIIALMVTKPF